MGKLSRAGNTAALDGALGLADQGTFTGYLALLTSAASDDVLGTEYAAAGYARQSVEWNAPTVADPPVVTNETQIVFGPFTGSTGATVVGLAVMTELAADVDDDASIMVAYWVLDTPRTPDVNDTLTINAAALSLSAN